jgi:hypothetical protein
MENAKKLANRFREVTLNGTWIANTNFKHQLEGTRWELATAQVHSLNTIAVLTQHINYYIAGVLVVFKGGSLDIRDKYSFEFAPITSQEQWEQVLDKFWADAEEFANQVEQMSDEQLESGFVKAEYGTYRRNVEGMIEHCYYHLGQISLIKKMVMAPL